MELRTKGKQHFTLTITPAIEVKERHVIEDVLKRLGYHIIGGGMNTDRSQCDVSFERIKDTAI